jgi:heme/copper-type cytochrome/quinol oxidase subunit 2
VDIAVVLVLFVMFGLGCTAFWIWSIVDAARTPEQVWMAAGQNKILWIVLIAVLGVVLSLVYVLWPRPELRRAADAGSAF